MTKLVQILAVMSLAQVFRLTASAASQTITFDPIPNQIFGVSPFVVAAQASSGLPVALTPTTPAVCRNASNLVMLFSVGTCSITASQPGNAGYSAAESVTRSFTVSMAKNGSGSFVTPAGSTYAGGTAPVSVLVTDLNGDGIPDLVSASIGSNSVTVLLGNGSGGFTAATGSPISLGTGPNGIAVGDFNGDGIPDLVTASASSNNVTLLLGNGAGGFTPAAGGPIAVGSGPLFVVVGDFNHRKPVWRDGSGAWFRSGGRLQRRWRSGSRHRE